jgi:hypothetical protein
MKFLIVKTPWYMAAAEYTDKGYPTQNVAPILKKLVYQYKTLELVKAFLDSKAPTYEYEIRDIAP